MQKRIAFICLLILIAPSLPAKAQLSTNPWLQPNTEEDVADVYEKNRKKNNINNIESYTPEETVVIDNTDYDTTAEESSKSNLLDKISGLFNSNSEPAENNTENTTDADSGIFSNESTGSKSSNSTNIEDFMPSMGGANNQISQSLRIPTMNANKIIRKIEKASGINFKDIARQMKQK